MTDPLVLQALADLRAEVAALRRELAPRRADRHADALLAAVEDEFGDGRFTTAGLLAIAADEPRGDLAAALAAVVDLNAAPRATATALGRLLARLPAVEVVAESRGVAVYRLRA